MTAYNMLTRSYGIGTGLSLLIMLCCSTQKLSLIMLNIMPIVGSQAGTCLVILEMDIYVYMCICVFLSEAMNSYWCYLDFKCVTTSLLVVAILLLLLSDNIMNEKVYVIRRYLCYDTKKSISNIMKFCHDCGASFSTQQ